MYFTTMRWFKHDHLPQHLQTIVKPFADLAARSVEAVPHNNESNPEIQAGLRKLLEAKDCFVRARLTGAAQTRSFNPDAEEP